MLEVCGDQEVLVSYSDTLVLEAECAWEVKCPQPCGEVI